MLMTKLLFTFETSYFRWNRRA